MPKSQMKAEEDQSSNSNVVVPTNLDLKDLISQVVVAVAQGMKNEKKSRIRGANMNTTIGSFNGKEENWFHWKQRVEAYSLLVGAGDHFKNEAEIQKMLVGMSGEAQENFKADDDAMMGVLVLNVTNDALVFELSKLSSVSRVWAFLVRRFESKTREMIVNLERKLNEFQISENEKEVFAQCEKMQFIGIQLEKAGVKMPEDQMVCRMINALPSSWQTIKDAARFKVETYEEQGKVFSVYDLMRYLESKENVRNQDNEKKNKLALAMAAGAKKKECHCNNCPHLKNHSTDRCRKTNEIWQRDKKEGNCFICHKDDHVISNCPEKGKRRKSSGSSAQTLNSNFSIQSTSHYSQLQIATTADEIDEDELVTVSKAISLLDEQESQNSWYIDSAASRHITNNQNLLVNMNSNCKTKVEVANGHIVKAKAIGDIYLKVVVKDREVVKVLKNALFVPEMRTNLISMGRASTHSELGFTVFGDMCRVYDADTMEVIKEIKIGDGIMEWDDAQVVIDENDVARVETVSAAVDINVLHRRMAHKSIASIKHAVKNGHVTGVKLTGTPNAECRVCMLTKTGSGVHTGSLERGTRPMEVIHSDVWSWELGGPYYIPFICGFTGYVALYYAEDKTASTVAQAFEDFVLRVPKLCSDPSVKIRTLHSDNGGEYKNTIMDALLLKYQITGSYGAAESPEQDGIAERFHQTAANGIRALLEEAGLTNQKEYIRFAVNAYAHIHNKSITKSCQTNKTPYEALTGRKPDLSYLRVFGSKCFVPVYSRKKMGNVRVECRLLGFQHDSPCYIVETLIPIEGRRRIRYNVNRKDVRFIEDERLENGIPSDDRTAQSSDPISFNNVHSSTVDDTNESSRSNTGDGFGSMQLSLADWESVVVDDSDECLENGIHSNDRKTRSSESISINNTHSSNNIAQIQGGKDESNEGESDQVGQKVGMNEGDVSFKIESQHTDVAGVGEAKPTPIMINGKPYYEVEKILDHGADGADNEMCYLIKWKNYTKPQWIRRSGLECAEMLIDYEKKHGLSQSPMSEDDEESIGNEDSFIRL